MLGKRKGPAVPQAGATRPLVSIYLLVPEGSCRAGAADG